MRVQPGSFLAGNTPAARRNNAVPAASLRPPENSGRGYAVKEQIDQQNKRHMSFLCRARDGMVLYQERMDEVRAYIRTNQGSTEEETVEQLGMAAEALAQLEESMNEIQESIENEQMEHTFILSSLEYMLDNDANFPVHTLEEYLKSKAEEQEGEECSARNTRRYTVQDLDKMIEAQRELVRGKNFSIEV